jgi:23S rRNA (uridine2552-2'-O)-methyltransferase
VYKLQELDSRFGILTNSRAVLDLGAAPGSWTKWVLEKLPPGGHVTAVDLQGLTKIPSSARLTEVVGDMTSPEIIARVTSLGPFDTILSDAAPATTGNRLVDTARSESLLEFALMYADTVLEKNGALVVKLFQGSDLGVVLKEVRKHFASAHTYKPKACRSNSFETYRVGLGKV